MRLAELIEGIPCRTVNFRDEEINGLEFDSRRVGPGALFIALVGERADGHQFIASARASGAGAVVTQREVAVDLPQVVVSDARSVMGVLAKKFYGTAERMKCVGVTGTNGKTTTAFLVHSILHAAGRKAGLIGTIFYLGDSAVKAGRTTPESLDIFKLFRQFYVEGARDVVMEVSSHALSLQRVDQVVFDVAVFTNLSQDHLDFHGTMENYKKAKLRLFDLLHADGCAVYNADDEIAGDIRKLGLPLTMSFSMRTGADVRGSLIAHSIQGIDMKVSHRGKDHYLHSDLVGTYNGHNIVAAFAAGCALGLPEAAIVRGIEALRSIRGRMEKAAENVFVDFAHTPRALENVLKTLRPYVAGRLIVVFGCGGDRDRGKRPLMGEAASRYADYAVITSDNPRSEDPGAIIGDIEKGMGTGRYESIADRREAIGFALKDRRSSDVVVIAGKGHEEYQIVRDRTIDFDDVKVVREILAGQQRSGSGGCTGNT